LPAKASTSTRRWPTGWASGSSSGKLEDLSFRFLEPETYKRIARMLDERRVEREQFIVDAVERLKSEVRPSG
jgi:(p)ppGpp synthase/HD superfamily hydrolase